MISTKYLGKLGENQGRKVRNLRHKLGWFDCSYIYEQFLLFLMIAMMVRLLYIRAVFLAILIHTDLLICYDGSAAHLLEQLLLFYG